MPIHRGVVGGRPYYQWGNQHRYFYTAGDERSRARARAKAVLQAQAIYAARRRKQ
jgi:hypothetical protein